MFSLQQLTRLTRSCRGAAPRALFVTSQRFLADAAAESSDDGSVSFAKVGDEYTVAKTITQQHINEFAEISEDRNPVHLDAEYAAKSRFKQIVAHGFLSSSLFSSALWRLCGQNGILLSYELKFKAPVHAGDEVHATAKTTKIKKGKGSFDLVATVNGKTVVEGKTSAFFGDAPA